MAYYLKMPKKSQVLALLELGWSYRRIEWETGVRRETVSGYDEIRRANAAKTFPGSKPPARFAAAHYHDTIVEKRMQRLTAQRIWQDLTKEFGYAHSYDSATTPGRKRQARAQWRLRQRLRTQGPPVRQSRRARCVSPSLVGRSRASTFTARRGAKCLLSRLGASAG
jgi:hypothetical protein